MAASGIVFEASDCPLGNRTPIATANKAGTGLAHKCHHGAFGNVHRYSGERGNTAVAMVDLGGVERKRHGSQWGETSLWV